MQKQKKYVGILHLHLASFTSELVAKTSLCNSVCKRELGDTFSVFIYKLMKTNYTNGGKIFWVDLVIRTFSHLSFLFSKLSQIKSWILVIPIWPLYPSENLNWQPWDWNSICVGFTKFKTMSAFNWTWQQQYNKIDIELSFLD